MHLEAKENGFDSGVFVDMNGNVGEGTNMNVAFVTKEGILKHPRFDNILSGCTVRRMFELAARLVESDLLNGIEIRDISVEEGRRSAEMMFFGSSIQVAPIVEWDGKMIGDGKPGPVAKALRNLLYEDRHSEDGPLTEIPYGPSKSTS
jgi:4-amino-4-deoxychorismate lyase